MKKSKNKKKNNNKSIKQKESTPNIKNNENINHINNPNTKSKEKTEKEKPKKKSEIEKLEEQFKKKLQKYKRILHIVASDGNCLFSSISDQVYGTDKHHLIIREKCMDYIEKNSLFYSQYIEGGEKQIPAYIKRKRKAGIWADNLEIEALAEIYQRTIEIYINPENPILIGQDKKRFPIKISYHGNKHYNSIVPTIMSDEYISFRQELIHTSPGLYENNFIKNFDPNKKFNEIFLNHNGKNNINIDEIFQDNIAKDEEFLLNEAIEKSQEINCNEINKINNEENIKESLNEKEEEEKYLQNPIIQKTLEFGFDLTEAIEALKICGNNSDLVFNYLYDKK